MSMTFTKLFSNITASTIWCEDPETKVVWITLLAMADKNGRVFGSIPGLAGIARVPLKSCRIALQKFLDPDPDSRTKDHEGRKIEEIDGGWHLLNHAKYRSLRDEEQRKEYKRKWISDKRSVDKSVDNVDKSRPQYTYADADADKIKSRVAASSVDKSVDNVDKSRPQYTYADADADADKIKSRVAASSVKSNDPRKAIFDLGLSVLGKDARSLIAKQLRLTNEERIFSVLGEMAASEKADPKAYFIAATSPAKAEEKAKAARRVHA
jgi:hypothetical protein